MTDHNEVLQFPAADAAEEFHTQEPHLPRPSRTIDPDNPSWGVGSAIFVWLVSLILSIFIPVIFLVPYASYRGITPGSPDYLPALTQFAMSDKTAVLIQVVALLPIHILTVLLIWAVVTRFGKQSFWEALGWGWAPRFRLWSCIGLGVLLFVAASVIAKWLGAETPTQLEQVINSSYAARIAISFLAVCTAPFVEEFVYRGVLYSALRRGIARLGSLILSLFSVPLDPKSTERMGVVGAVIIVLALFTLIHVPQYWPNLGVIAAVGLLSLALTLIRAYSGKLLPCIAIHLVFNGIQAVILLVEPYAQRFLPPTVTPPDPAAIFIHLIGFIN
ncbi:MAG TPA: CPBP family intramembrane glutamic endopeptidase [Pyrinomonadaceae bacterium]|nr:CPBP family intramembrane glutamic endopeptidase [Pyrinomonadaceae bacterium]